jgi:hypothetical protein
MENEKKKKKGLFSAIRESLNKTGGCCGPGETCGGPSKEDDKPTAKEKGSDKAEKR